MKQYPSPCTDYKTRIVEGGETAMLTADDVIDLMGETCVVLVDEAIFAATARPLGYGGSQFVGDIIGHGQESGEL